MNEPSKHDDPRLTAYALGELEEEERARVAAWLERDEAARHEVAELGELAQILERELESGAGPRLQEAQRARIEAALAGRGRVLSWRAPRVAATLAAAVALAWGAVAWWGAQREGSVPIPGTPSRGERDAITARVEPDAHRREGLRALGYSRSKATPGLASSAGPAAPAAPGASSVPEPPGRLREIGYLDAGDLPAEEVMEEPALAQVRRQADGEAPRGRDEGRSFRAEPLELGKGAARTEAYDPIEDNPFVAVANDPRSTFSIDVDTASYANVRRFLRSGQLPPPGAVRIEEMINYFDYAYPEPAGPVPFSVSTEVAGCPWSPGHRLVRIGLKGRQASFQDRPRNLVFLIDVSGSMDQPDKLPLLVSGMSMLVDTLGERDQVAIVVYAGASGLVLPPTPGSRKDAIVAALEHLDAGGSTNGGAGIELAYATAERNFVTGGINRVILATDGDFNVGTTSRDELVRLIEKERETGVFLSVLGFGTGNLQDATMEQLADHGNGSYHYIDSLNEARKVLVHDVNATLETIAKDVKIQVEFNPAEVTAFRLIGYENRVLAHQDFNDDRKDAGEIGAGHTVTALYEIVPAGTPFEGPRLDPLRYQPDQSAAPSGLANGELLTVALRWKEPDAGTSSRIEVPVRDPGQSFSQASDDFRFAAAVALFGMVLRHSPHCGSATAATVLELAQSAATPDPWGYRAEFLDLVQHAQ